MLFTGRKLVFTILIAVVVLLLAAGGGIVWKYQKDLNSDAPIEQLGKVKITPVKPVLGSPVKFTAKFKCPWHRKPLEAFLTVPRGLREVGSPEIKREKLGFGYGVWTVSAVVKPYRTGGLKQSSLQVEFNRKGEHNKITDMTLKIPGIEVASIKPDDVRKLNLAEAIEKKDIVRSNRYTIAIIAIVVAILIIAAVLIRKSRRQGVEKILSPWQVAFLELTGLREAITGHTMQPEKCFSKLTDIVRSYLEKRFNLRAPQQTTDEFLRDLNRSDSVLQEKHSKFLKDFMTAADLVKFANMPADGELLNQAVDKAEALVSETKPEQENDK